MYLYTKMSSILIKRLSIDIEKFNSSNYAENGIFIHVDETNMTNIKALIIGAEGTPYEDGFHLFQINIPTTYPYDPPTVKYITGDGVTRFNPNLYVEGKVCLSIIKTWPGPPWSPLFTFGTILLSIQSMILNSEPLTNEPGLENSNKQLIKKYNDFIEHQNLKVALIDQYENIPKGFENFKPIFTDYIHKNKLKIRERILKLKETMDQTQISLASAFNCNVFTNYSNMLERFENIISRKENKD